MAPDPWPAVQAIVLIGIVIVPVAVQAFAGWLWLRRRVKRSGAEIPLSLGWFLAQALGFWLFCCVSEFAAVFAGENVAKNMGHPLGYLGFALIALLMIYAGFGLVVGLLLAAMMWRTQQKDS